MDLDPKEIVEYLCYKYIILVLLLNPDGNCDVLTIEVDL